VNAMHAPRPEELLIKSIIIGDGRLPVVEKTVAALADSIGEVGLLNPIIVFRAAGHMPTLIAGRHRLEACKRLKMTTIQCRVVNADDDEVRAWATLAEIDENLIRRDLTPAQRAKLIAQRKAAYEAVHPETKHGGAKGAGRGKVSHKDANLASFVTDTAAKSGKSGRSIARDATRAKALGTDLERIAGTTLDKGAELDALAAMPAPERQAIISRAASGEKVSAVCDAASQVARSGYSELLRMRKSFRSVWQRASEADREAFVEFVAETEQKLSLEVENEIRIVEIVIVLSRAVVSANEAAARVRTTNGKALFVKERLPAALAWLNEFSDALNKTGCEDGDGHG
jgi:ParB family chromosome partitioning protein